MEGTLHDKHYWRRGQFKPNVTAAALHRRWYVLGLGWVLNERPWGWQLRRRRLRETWNYAVGLHGRLVFMPPRGGVLKRGRW